MKIFLEYGCPKGKFSCSVSVKITKEGFWYKGQITLSIRLLELDCVKEQHSLKICEDCPVNGKIKPGSVTLWDTEKSWNPIGSYKNQEYYWEL